MNFENDKDGERKRKVDHPRGGQSADKPRTGTKEPRPEVGQALRSIYQRTIDESIPPEMLDLLGKLG